MNELCGLIADVLGVDREGVTKDTGPLTLPRWDSLNHMRLVAAIEETYGVQMSTDEITSLTSVADIAALLHEKGVRVD